jgi:hypothetical protein
LSDRNERVIRRGIQAMQQYWDRPEDALLDEVLYKTGDEDIAAAGPISLGGTSFDFCILTRTRLILLTDRGDKHEYQLGDITKYKPLQGGNCNLTFSDSPDYPMEIEGDDSDASQSVLREIRVAYRALKEG